MSGYLRQKPYIVDRLARADRRRMTLQQMLDGRSRGEMIGLFLALLELARQQQVAVRQDNADSPVEIELLQVDDTVGDASGNAVGATGKANGVAEAPTTT